MTEDTRELFHTRLAKFDSAMLVTSTADRSMRACPLAVAPAKARASSPGRITQDDIARAARELVAAYGPAAIHLMKQRTRAVRRRGDAESAALWLAVADAIEQELGAGQHS